MNKTLKNFVLIPLLVMISLVVILFGAVMYFTSGLSDTAEQFFQAVKRQDIAAARGYLSEEFKASTDEAALKAFLASSSIGNYKSVSWSSRSISNGTGELSGTITTESNGTIPLTLKGVKEGDSWKIYSLQKSATGIQTSDASKAEALPADAEQLALVRQGNKDFAESVHEKSMEHFHKVISSVWQKQFSVKQLEDAYKPLIDVGVDFRVFDSVQPTLEKPATIDENGVLLIKGNTETDEFAMSFEQKFLFEGVTWKLVGYKCNIQSKQKSSAVSEEDSNDDSSSDDSEEVKQ